MPRHPIAQWFGRPFFAPLLVLLALAVSAAALLWSSLGPHPAGNHALASGARRSGARLQPTASPSRHTPASAGQPPRGKAAAPPSTGPAASSPGAGARAHGPAVLPDGTSLRAEGRDYVATFADGGVTFARKPAFRPAEADALDPAVHGAPRHEMSFSLREVWQGKSRVLVAAGGAAPKPRLDGDRVVYERGAAVTEAYACSDDGVEQSFQLARPLAEAGDLVLVGDLRSDLVPTRLEPGIDPICLADPRDGRAVLSYGSAVAIDARGRRQPMTSWASDQGTISLACDASWLAEAEFPVLIDPTLSSAKVNVAPMGFVAACWNGPANGFMVASNSASMNSTVGSGLEVRKL
ncbi:MAG: hypothetical protein HYZ53_02135, partial [Planctomycetes bacterium]|nr:hypothetical protein [Planctomycetota bacterium]